MLRLAFVIAALNSGCIVHSLLGGSTTVPKGDFEAAAQVGLSRDLVTHKADDNQFTVEAAFRYGFTERFDLGVRVFGSGAALEGRFQIYRADGEPRVNTLVSLVGGFGGQGPNTQLSFGRQAYMPFGTLKVVLGIQPLQWLELVFAPGVTLEYAGEAIPIPPPDRFSVRGSMIGVGGSIAVVWHLPRGWRVAPEVTGLFMAYPEKFAYRLRPFFGVGVFKQF